MKAAWAALIAILAVAGAARADDYPSRPITIIVPFAAGGPSDAMARVLAERMRTSLGQPLVIENVTSGCPSDVRIRSASTRAIASDGPPAAKGTMMVMGREG